MVVDLSIQIDAYAAFSLRAELGEKLVAEQVLAAFRPTVQRLILPRSSTGNGGAGDHEAVGGVMAVRRRAMEYRSE